MFIDYECPTCRRGQLTVKMTADGLDYDLVEASRWCGSDCKEAFLSGRHSDAVFSAFAARNAKVDDGSQFPTYAERA